MPYIKFPTIKKERIFHVFLNNKGPQSSITISFSTFQSQPDIFKFITQSNSITSVATLSRFDDPYISIFLLTIFIFFVLHKNSLEPFPFRVM